MYSMVLMAAMMPAGDAAGFGKHKAGCTGTPVYGCTGAPTYGCTGTHTGGFLGLYKHSCTGGGFLGLHKHGCTGTPVYGCTGTPTYGCTGGVVVPTPTSVPDKMVKPDPKTPGTPPK